MRRPLVLCALVFGLAWMPLAAREPTALEQFERQYASSDPHVRRVAVERLRDVRGRRAVDALLAALDDADAGVRRAAAARLCAGRDREDETAALVAALDDPRARVRRVAARALGRVPHALGPLRAGLADREALVRADMLASIARIQGESAGGVAAAVLARDAATPPRIVAARILARHPHAAGVPALAAAARDPVWSVRVAAARALGEYGEDAEQARRAAAALVSALAIESRRRVRDAQAEALFLLTGIDFGPEPDRWSAWFADVGDTFAPPARRPHGPGASGASERPLGLPVASDHVCFVLDSSRSMNDAAGPGVQATKHEALVVAFERVVGRLPAGSYMNLVTFGTTARRFRPSLFAASRPARRAAVRHLAETVPAGRTNIWGALSLAFGDEDVDTIVLVSDGAPSAGRRRTRTEILDGLHDLNRFRLVRIHTVAVGAANTGARWRGFMAQIAAATGGRYLER